MKRCRLLPPEWLSPAALAAVDEAERASGSRFEPLPEGFLEVGRLLLTRCRGEFETREYDEVRVFFSACLDREGEQESRKRRKKKGKLTSLLLLLPSALRKQKPQKNETQISGLLESVRSARYGKLRDGIGQLTGPMAVKLTNITASELNAVRPFFLGALTAFVAVTAPPGRGGNNGAAPAVEAAAETAEAAPAAAATAPPPPASWSQQPQQQSQSQRFRTRNRD